MTSFTPKFNTYPNKHVYPLSPLQNISLYGFIGVLQMHAIVEKLKALNTMYAFCVPRIER